ncbi:hypothetical protein Tco_0752321 [Tanacetum coccineum]|uniref:Retrotransposon gag domain-containing protein n=1 Tax=Tanacetum coccineum TaxID=301880 RepID=A0ABQ4Z9P0_9ASTR
MGDENPIRTLGDYSKPSHEGYRNTIELPAGNDVVPLRSDTIWTAKLRNDILMFQQHHGESLSEAWTRFKDLLQKVPHHGIDLWLQVQIFYNHVNPVTRRTIDQSAGGKLPDLNPKESWAILEDLALYDNETWNDPRDFTKPVKAITLPQDVPSTSDRCLIKLENQVQRLMEAHLAPTQPTQVNKITTPCEICSGPQDTQNCMENPEQAFVEYTSSRTDEAGVLKAITDRIAGTLPSDMDKNLKLGTHPVSSARSYPKMNPQCSTQIHSLINAMTIHPKKPEESYVNELVVKQENPGDTNSNPHPQPDPLAFIATEQEDDGEVMFIEIIRDDDEPQNKDPNKGEWATMEEPVVEYFDTFPTRNELTYHRFLMSGSIPSIFLRNPIITEGCPYNLKIPCNIRHVHIEKAYIDLNSPLNIMTRIMYNWIMRRKLNPRENANGGISNFTGRIKGMHVFVGNFTYVVDFLIVEDISSIIDPRTDKVAYKMPHKIEQYDSLSDLEKEHIKSVYLRNEEDKRRGVELYLMRRSLEVLRKFHWMILGGRFNQLSHVSSPLLSKPGEY